MINMRLAMWLSCKVPSLMLARALIRVGSAGTWARVALIDLRAFAICLAIVGLQVLYF